MTDWIIALASWVTAFTIIILWKQLTADHERSRREKAVQLLQDWTINLNHKSSIARKFAETLSADDARALYKQEAFKVDSKFQNLVQGCLNGNSSLNNPALSWKEGEDMDLSVKVVSEIRWEVISFLNMLEAVLTAWRHNIADREILMEEFQYLVSPEEGHYILKEFRTAAGGRNAYPAIEDFVLELESRKSNVGNGKQKIA